MANPRRANGSRRDAVRKWLRSQGRPCWICGLPIDYGLPARHPLSFECDELVPVSLGGSPYLRENVGASHRVCNGWRSARELPRVEAVRNSVLSARGGWASPEEFVALAKDAERAMMAQGPGGVRQVTTTTEW